MRPLWLSMEGFGPFSQRTEIDFSDVDLAAIVGPTGAGKSTIIDAVTFALYGSVARYDDLRSVAPAVSQSAAEARVLLRFESSGAVYEAARRVVRTSLDRATTKQARLERIDPDADTGDRHRTVEVLAAAAGDMPEAVRNVVGLDFAQFTKTVVLPQGRFAQFLHDTPADRQQALSQILDLGVYARVGRRAREQARAAAERIAGIEAAAGDPTDPDAIETAAVHVEQIAAAREQCDINLRTAAQHTTTADTAAAAAADCRARAAAAAAAATVPADVRAAAAAAAETETRSAAAADTADRAAAAAAAALLLVVSGPQPDRCLHLIDVCEHAATTDTAAAAAVGAAAKAAEQFGAARHTAAEADTAETAAETAAAHARSAASAAAETAATAAAAASPELLEHARGLHDRRRELVDRVADTGVVAGTAETAANETAATALAAADIAQAAARVCAEQTHLRRLTAELEPDADCPVCGQQVTDPPAAAAAVVDQTADTDSAAAQAAADADAAAAAAIIAHAAHDTASAMLRSLDDQLASLPTTEDLNTAAAAAATAATAAAAADTAAAVADVDRRNAASAYRVAQTALAAEQAAADTAAATAVVAAETAASAAAAADGFEPGKLRADLVEARSNSAAAGTAAKAAETAAARARHAAAAAVAARDVQNILADGYSAARDRLLACGLATPSAAGDLLTDWETLAVHARQAAADNGAAAEHAAGTAAAEHAAAEAGHAAAYAAASAHIDCGTDPNRWLELLASVEASAEQKHTAAVETAARRLRLEQQAETLRHSRDVARTLGTHLQADGFERWRMHEAAADLTERATGMLLELSAGRYGLASDNGTIAVVDHFNGGVARAAKTLSGGETFLASLALALALAEETAATAGGLESLFIDEGFGALDAETLDAAAAAVETLGNAGKMVCIVTHIPELADRMPVRYQVAKTVDGSTVCQSAD